MTSLDPGVDTPSNADGPLLQVSHLKFHFRGGYGVVRAVDDVSLSVAAGECVGIVGESGSGKTMLARALVRLVPKVPIVEFSGDVSLDGVDVAGTADDGTRIKRKHLRQLRMNGMSMVFQEPLSHLNPTMRIGRQIREGIPSEVPDDEQDEMVADLLASVELPRNVGIERLYPHQLSGGMRQRVMIALALATQPKVLVADEPTTGLDVTVQADVLRTLSELHKSKGMGLVLITHDLGIVARMCDRVYVMYAGHVVEEGAMLDLFERPKHPYTRALMDSRPGRRLKGVSAHKLGGSVPDLSQLGEGCRFLDRCGYAQDGCEHDQELTQLSGSARVRCHVVPDMDTRGTTTAEVTSRVDN